eukprot:COSAG01_NODE_1213_length_11210_cov_9.262353_7_plen_33_part_00
MLEMPPGSRRTALLSVGAAGSDLPIPHDRVQL